MKALALVFMLMTSAAFAGEVIVIESELPRYVGLRTSVETRFQMDTRTTEGFAKVTVSEEDFYQPHPYPYPGGGYYDQWGRWVPAPHRPMPMPTYRTIFQETIKVDGLMLVGNKVMFQAAEGEVDCGTLKKSSVFRVPTIYLSGKCELQGRIVRDGRDQKVVVKLITK